MGNLIFDKSKVRQVSLDKEIPITEYILRASYHNLKKRITILGISPISEQIIKAALLSANKLKAPIKLIASLNQVDYDGGYTGWTPRNFIKLIGKFVDENNINIPIIIGLDHCGPWLKDKHVIEKYDLDTAMNEARKSLKEAIIAGYDVIHIDTTVEIGTDQPGPNPTTVAERTVDLIEYAEEIRKSKGLPPINYEVGSDRWIYKDIDHIMELLRLIFRNVREKKLDDARILFIVGDVGTRVAPNNFLNENKARILVRIAEKFHLYVKTHSTDYVKNPETFPRIGIGGANIGPMFADLTYKFIKKLVVIEERLYRNGQIDFKSEIISKILNEIINDGRWRKYVKTKRQFFNLINTSNDYIIGLCLRYVINKPSVQNSLKILFENIRKSNIYAEKELIEYLSRQISFYLTKFNLADLIPILSSL